MKTGENTPMTPHQVKEQVRAHFAGLAAAYHLRNYETPVKRDKYPDIYMRHCHILALLDGQTAGRALEVGIGAGQMMADLRVRGYQVYGVDLSSEMALSARTFLEGRAPNRANCIAAADVEHLCFADGSFDLVVAAGVIEYLPETARALSEIARVLTVGGTAILSVRNRFALGRPLIAIRDLLASLPGIGAAVELAMRCLRALLRRDPDRGKVFARRELPWRFRRDLRRCGLVPLEQAFYHFSVFPPAFERSFPTFCITVGTRLERLSRTPLGYVGRGLIVKARKL